MRIVHYLSSVSLKQGGVTRAVLDMCAPLAAAGHRVTLLHAVGDDVPSDWRVDAASNLPSAARDLPVAIRLPGGLGPGGWLGRAAMSVVRDTLRDADVVHIHAMWSLGNDQIARAARRAGVPTVWSPHGMLDDWSMSQRQLKKRLYLRLSTGPLLRAAASVHCTAQAELDQAGKWFGRERGVVIPLVFDLGDYRELPGAGEAQARFGLRANRPKVLFLSRLHEKKGVEVLLRAKALLKQRGVDCELLIAGTGEEEYVRSLHALAGELGLERDTLFVGFVTGRLKVSLYQAAAVFALPSSQENFGFAVVEALAASVPVVTTKGVALWPDVERQDAGKIAEQTPEAFAAAIAELLNDPELARAMGERGRAWVLREFDADRIAARFVDLYQRAIAARGV